MEIFFDNEQAEHYKIQFDRAKKMMAKIRKSIKSTYEELINLLLIIQTTQSMPKEIGSMVISLESRVNCLKEGASNYIDDLNIREDSY